MPEMCYRTGAAAKLLGLSSYEIRRLAEAGLIEAEYSGKQWRFPASEVERLQKAGVPPIPAAPPVQAGAPPSQRPKAGANGAGAGLLAPPSEDLIAATEEVVLLENEVKSLGLRKQRELGLDWFRERESAEAEREAEQIRQEQSRLARDQAKQERDVWLQRWERYALHALPDNAEPQDELDLDLAVRTRLAGLAPIPDQSVARKLVDAEVRKIVQAQQRRHGTHKAIERAVDDLPSEARSYWEPTPWQLRATEAARQAVRQLPVEATMSEIEAVTRRAVELVTREFEAHLAAQADTELRQHLIRRMIPDGLTEQGKEMAAKAIRGALAELPQGTSRNVLDRAVEEALAPFRDAIAQVQAQAQAEQRRIQDRADRATVLNLAPLALPGGFSSELRPAALAAIAKALDALPEGSSQRESEEARDKALAPFVAAHDRRRRKEEIIEAALRDIYPYLVRLEESWDFEGQTARSLAQQFQAPIRAALEEQLTGQEQPELVARLVRRLVERQLSATPEPALLAQ